MAITDDFWKLVYTSKHNYYYFEEYLSSDRKINNRLNIFNAIASCGSIGGWVIWNDYSFIWACIIAVSQVINAINEYLPYQKRIKIIMEIVLGLSNLSTRMECDWFSISNGEFTKKEIREKLVLYKSEYMKITDKSNSSIDIPEKDKYEKIAMEKVKKNYL